MGDSEGDSEQEALRALELADGYLEDAENVLWTAAIETNAEQVCVPMIFKIRLRSSRLILQLNF